MDRETKREILDNYCNKEECRFCKLNVGGWDKETENKACLWIPNATDRDLDRALKLIGIGGSEDNYQALAMRTNDEKGNDRLLRASKIFKRFKSMGYDQEEARKICYDPGELLNGALGLTGESGEVADMIKKYIFHGHDLDRDELIKELGDVCWYLALLCTAIEIDLSEVMSRNIEKLKARYPEGFSESASINRTE